VDRAVALAPGRAPTQLALAVYDRLVRREYAEAVGAAEAGLKAAPDNTDLLVQAAGAMQSVGKWGESLQNLEHARALDPRSAATFGSLARTYLRLRRYPEALAAADQTLVLAPGDLGTLEAKTMVYLAQGDLAGARRTIAAAPSDVSPTTLVAAFANIWDLYWALDDAEQQLVLRLPPSAYDGDRATWATVLAQTAATRGNAGLARAYADSAIAAIDKLLAVNPSDAQSIIFRGLMLAYLGRKDEAIREGTRGLALQPPSLDQVNGAYFQHQLARIYTVVGEQDKALDLIEPLMKMPYWLSSGWLRIDPNFAPLRSNPRFQRLVASH
jgi:adenylate cyclase